MDRRTTQRIELIPISRRTAVGRILGTVAGLAIVNAYDDGDQGGSDSGSADQKIEGTEATPIILRATNILNRVLSGNTKEVSAHCHPELGQPTGNGICPDDRRGKLRMFGFHFEDLKEDGKYRLGERPVSTVKDHRFIEIQFWGAEKNIYSPDPKNEIATRRRLIAYEGGNGTAVDIETEQPFVTVGVRGPVEDWEDGIDKLDGQKKPLPLIRFQFRWMDPGFNRIIFDQVSKKPGVWEGCAWLCPVGVEPTEADYYIATPKTRDQLSNLGLKYRPEEMAVPQGAPRSAVWTSDLR